MNKTLFIAIILLALGAGCDFTAIKTDNPSINYPKPVVSDAKPAAKLPQNVQRISKTFSDGRIVSLLLIKTNPDWTWQLKNDPTAPKTVQAWRNSLDAKLVINGSYFNEQMQPTGFYQSNDTTSSLITWPNELKRQDKFSYTGIINFKNGKINLSYLPTSSAGPPLPGDETFLSYPTLALGGHNLIETDSQKYSTRNALVESADGTIYIAITESGLISLYELADLLIQNLNSIRIAVNLDGGSSTGISYHDGDTALDIISAPVPNVIYIK